MDIYLKRILDITLKNHDLSKLSEQEFLMDFQKTVKLNSIVDEYAPLNIKDILHGETSLEYLEERILEVFHKLGDTEYNKESIIKLRYWCSQKLILERYSTLYFSSIIKID